MVRKNWFQLRLLYVHASESNFGHLFEQPYRYFQAMIIVGALTELDLYEHRFSVHEHFERAVIGFLFQIRSFAADEWHEPLIFNDSESEYYAKTLTAELRGYRKAGDMLLASSPKSLQSTLNVSKYSS